MALAPAEPTTVEEFPAWACFRNNAQADACGACPSIGRDIMLAHTADERMTRATTSVYRGVKRGGGVSADPCSSEPALVQLFASFTPDDNHSGSACGDLCDWHVREAGTPGGEAGKPGHSWWGEVHATILSREADAWPGGRPSGRDASLQLTEFNVALPPAEVYRRTVLDD